jgi:PAP2 superfamily
MKKIAAKLEKPLSSTIGILRYKHSYLIAVMIFLVVWKAFWAPDILFLIFLSIFIVYGYGKEYIRKFAPFVILLFSYDALRGLVPFISGHVHFTEMIRFDLWIGHGQLPTVALQHLWYHGSLHWYDYYFYFTYMLHFLAPFTLAMLIWRYRPGKYWQYAGALLALSYAGFLTYMLFPAAPPWMASDLHLTAPIAKLSTLVWWGWGVHNIPTLYAHFNPNPVAAVPSLHAAYPMLDFLFVNKLFGRKISLPFLIYPISVWVGVVYMGEHYVFDVILGVIYALGAFYASEFVIARGWHRPVVARVQSRIPRWAGGQRAPVAATKPLA